MANGNSFWRKFMLCATLFFPSLLPLLRDRAAFQDGGEGESCGGAGIVGPFSRSGRKKSGCEGWSEQGPARISLRDFAWSLLGLNPPGLAPGNGNVRGEEPSANCSVAKFY